MRILPSWWFGGAAAGAVLVGALYVSSAGLPLSGGPTGPAEGDRLDRLEADREVLERRREVVRSLVSGVIEGRLSLRQAAAVLREENRLSPPHLVMHLEYGPGATEEERYGRAVLAHVRAVLDRDPRRPAVLARVEAEVEALARAEEGRRAQVSARGGRRPPLPPDVVMTQTVGARAH
jgi:hypothetical protein